MSQTLYRKYRPQKFSDVIGQNHIVQTVTNAIKNDRIGHAYLFTGPRGTGKTSMARLFAKAINCANSKESEPCLECENCKNIQDGRSLDIIEIDAASNTGVDNIRELRETIKLPPTRAKYKVYIIDEVHMLSSGAFNALLKTLEEPPAHVIFILATTEIHKVPETILSRCQRFDFVRLSLENIVKKLSSIAKSEDVKIEKNALEMIAVSAEGGMRDAESLLAQVIALEDKNITAKEVEEILGTTDRQSVEKMAELLLEKNIPEALGLVNSITNEGYNLEVFNKSLLNYLRQLLVISVDEKLAETFTLELTAEQLEKTQKIAKNKTAPLLKLLENFSEIQNKIKSSFIPQLPLEMAIVKLANYEYHEESPQIKPSPVAAEHPKVPSPKPEIKKENYEVEIEKPKVKEDINEIKEIAEIKNNKSDNSTDSSFVKESDISINQVTGIWNNLIREVKPFNHSLSAFLVNCQPTEIKDNCLIIVTKYKFYKDKLGEAQNKLTIENALAKLLEVKKMRIRILSEDEAGIKINPVKYPVETGYAEGVFNRVNPTPYRGAVPPEAGFNRVNPPSAPSKPKETSSLLNDALEMMGGKIVEE
ncbi:MAG: DNA polymerase III subunit gamma/tau [bacterium]|nr:DNA polymerase III subunit gamma/tau [bacterium]